ncbi:hypothetical protein A6B38_02395 [Bartonella bacilliformis]|uniref:Uncharacterized protein n=2 Tax=Bartonella bacilliformis TaxID=774 RepID=A1US18_BARBK|nr:hypothetical protein BARBAKC583_0454 [Bartonella bacilliformis KC583]AMG85607.1 hypothetical protein AL467_02210 [Bartonella bacilliformis]EKS45020.1 hypothetical protein BbINS_02109 [Bartonella bacilliformis INS]KZM37872.1 hypothetical protein AWH67_02570 [Bartonella bacilliformis]KZN21922.1 hypothetical protein A6B38_02395 [Bartonella bacilliformis]
MTAIYLYKTEDFSTHIYKMCKNFLQINSFYQKEYFSITQNATSNILPNTGKPPQYAISWWFTFL